MPQQQTYRHLPPQRMDTSIAVLPFVNRSSDEENEYFSDGITEEIINALTQIQGLKVIARTSSFAFKNQQVDVREIGQQLGVTTVLEGSVRKAEQRVRISAQLISTQDGTHLWSKRFDREMEDIFALQDEISLLIADQIRENFGHMDIQDQLIEAPTQNIDAYQLYLKARYHHLKWNAEGLTKGAELYEASIELDPDFALPYLWAGMGYGINASWGFMPYEEGIQRADELLKKGLALGQGSFLAYYAMATVSFFGKWDFRAGHQQLTQSMALNPSFTDVEEGLAELYTAVGDFPRAMAHTQNILTLNPLSPNHYYTEGNIHYLSGQYEQAITSMFKALRIDSDFALAIEMITLCCIHLHDYERLEDILQRYPAEQPLACRALYALKYPEDNIDFDLSQVRTELLEQYIPSLIPWHLYLHIYLGNHDLALTILEKGVEKRGGQFVNFKNDPLLQPLHANSRFQKLLDQIFRPANLPDHQAEVTETVDTKSKMTKEDIESYLKQIKILLTDDQLFLDQNLSLKSLAGQIDLHPNKLSWLLNDQIGKNFNEFVNSYRLEAFKVKALDPANQHLTLLGLAYESGFNSKTAFNAFFKRMENMTPRAWVKQQLQ